MRAKLIYWYSASSLERATKLLSLTLRDAQHLACKTFKKLEKMDETRAASFNSAASLVNRASEMAEKMRMCKNSQDSVNKEIFGKLLSELLFSMLILAEDQGVSLEDSFLQSVDELILSFVS